MVEGDDFKVSRTLEKKACLCYKSKVESLMFSLDKWNGCLLSPNVMISQVLFCCTYEFTWIQMRKEDKVLSDILGAIWKKKQLPNQLNTFFSMLGTDYRLIVTWLSFIITGKGHQTQVYSTPDQTRCKTWCTAPSHQGKFINTRL